MVQGCREVVLVERYNAPDTVQITADKAQLLPLMQPGHGVVLELDGRNISGNAAQWVRSSEATATYEMKLKGMPTGLTLNFANSTYNADNLYTSTKPKYTSLLCKRGSLLLWYSTKPLVESVREPLTDSELIACNTYYLAHRYKRSVQDTRPGVVQLRHN
jgi:hypothetical protein